MVFQTLALLVASLGMYRGSIDSSASFPLTKSSLNGGNQYLVSYDCSYSDLFGSGTGHRPLPSMTATYTDSSSSSRIPVADYDFDRTNHIIHFEWQETLNCSYYVRLLSYSDDGDMDNDFWSNTVNMFVHEDPTVDYAWIDVSSDFIDWNTDWNYRFEFYFTFVNVDIYNLYHDTDSYSMGYNDGYNDGYKVAVKERDEYWSNKIDIDTGNARTEGYNQGYQDGQNSAIADYGFSRLFLSIADTPVLMFRRLFDFSLFGTSVLSVVLSLFTCLIVIHLVKKVLK